MKKYFYLSFLGLLLTILFSCAEKKDTKPSANETEESMTEGDVTEENADKKRTYKSYQAACRAEDFEEALAFVDELEMKAMELDKYDRYISENVNAYTSARDYVFNAEVQFLLANGSKEASDRVLFLLNSLPMKGKRLEEGYEGTNARSEICDGSAYNKDFAWYCESVNSYNDKCRQIMELCIARGNKYLADKVIDLVKETPTSQDIGGFEHKVHYTDHDRVTIQKMYKQAISRGALK